MIDIKKIADILHNLYCRMSHETQMELMDKTDKCVYYLEESIDRTWEMKEHQEWLQQAQCLVSVSHPLSSIEVLRDIIEIYQITEKLRKVNPKLTNYILMLIK